MRSSGAPERVGVAKRMWMCIRARGRSARMPRPGRPSLGMAFAALALLPLLPVASAAATRAVPFMASSHSKPFLPFDFESAAAQPLPLTPESVRTAPRSDVEWQSAQLWSQLRLQAEALASGSPMLEQYMSTSVLNHASLPEALGCLLADKLQGHGVGRADLMPMLVDLCSAEDTHRAALADLLQVAAVDPASPDSLTVLLHFKGFHALQTYRVAHQLWTHGDEGSKHAALLLQGRGSATFGVDIHPGARIGQGVFLDHGTGIVIGETARVGDFCYLLHGVTLGSTGRRAPDGRRHPEVGHSVHIGASATLLGPISVGDRAIVGAKAIVTKPVDPGATVVGTNKVLEPQADAKPAKDAKGGDLTWLYEI